MPVWPGATDGPSSGSTCSTVLDSRDDDIAYYYASRLAGEPEEGVLDTHFHPLEPRTMRARFVLRF